VGEENYYLFVVCREHPGQLYRVGDCGVGRTSFGPGIRDCLYGVLYIAPSRIFNTRNPGAYTIKSHILKYYGVEQWKASITR
jgi:hypothetical protein